MTSRDTPADGNLPLQGDPGSVTLYLPGEQLTATTVNGTTTVTGARIIALPSGGDVVRTGSGSSYYFEVPDQQGTEELELNDTAQVPTWRQFTPYGAPRGETVTWADNRGFLNQPTDPDTGLTYDGARAYDPVTARFISPDPVLEVSDPQDLDPYDYAEDNPVTGSDPTGQLPVLTNGDGVPQPGQTAKVDAEAEANGYDNQLSGNGGGGYGSSSGYGAGGCGYAGLSCHQGILGSYVPGPAPVVTPAVVSPPPAPPRPKRVTVPESVTGSGFCTGRLMQLGACPSESGAAGTTPAQVRQSFEGAGMVLASVIPVGDLFDALLGGEAAADAGEGSELAQAAKSCSPVLGGASFTAGTEVLLASGKAVPVDTVRPGEKVLATSTKTGKTSPETVTAVEVHHDTDLYDLTVKSGGKVSVIDTTSSHLFWDPYLHYWVTANKLSKGERLETPDGTLAVVDGGSTPKVHDGWMWDLTVPGNNDHDFYVLSAEGSSHRLHHADAVAVLVHNSSCISAADIVNDPDALEGLTPSQIDDLARNAGYDVQPGSASAANPATRYYLPGTKQSVGFRVLPGGVAGQSGIKAGAYLRFFGGKLAGIRVPLASP